MLQAMRTSQFDQSMTRLDLGVGQPGFDLLPWDKLAQAAAHLLPQNDTALLNYGLEAGDAFFRQELAAFLTPRYGYDLTAVDLFITAGASSALDLICTLFTQPGDLVLVEEPTYFLALRLFADHGLRVRGVPLEKDGLNLAVLEELLYEEKPALLYTVPTFQNPTGITLSATKRRKLAELAEAHGFLIVADEVYHLLDYTAVPPAPLAALVPEGAPVLSIGSFSKIFAPGVRLGWVTAGSRYLEKLAGSGLLDSGGGLNPFMSGLLRSALQTGLAQAHLAWLKEVYGRRTAVLTAALREFLPAGFAFDQPEGGFFVWVRGPEEMDTAVLLPAAHSAEVGYQLGHKFSAAGGQANCMRLSFAFYKEESLREGARRLGRVLDNRA